VPKSLASAPVLFIWFWLKAPAAAIVTYDVETELGWIVRN